MYIDKGRIMNDFIEPNKIQYSIPVYQRNYEWSNEQCIKLFEDIVAAHKKQKPHFCGSIVYSTIDLGQKINTYIVIDGQQRMTTIYILLKALMDCAQEDSEKEAIAKTLFNVDKFDKFGIDVSTKLKLKPVKSDNEQLLLLMDSKYEQLDKNSDIWNNYKLFTELITNKLNEGLTVNRIYDGLEWLIVAKIRLENDDSPQEIFERINSTGLPLSLSDKIRNFILMTDIDQERLYEDYWLQVEKTVKIERMTDYFLDYLNMKVDVYPRENDAYDIFKQLFIDSNSTHESMLQELLHYSRFYGAFMYGSKQYSSDVNLYLEGLRKLKQTTVFVFLFKVFDDYENNVIDNTELVKVLQFLQNYSIRRLICEIGSNSLRGLYKTLYSRVFNIEENKKHYYDSIVSFFKQLTSRDALPDDGIYREALKNNNLYRKNALCKFILAGIENKGKEKVNVTNLTIEHIMPQNKNLSTSWQNMLGDNWNEIHEKYMHTLGNLMLTGYNSELGDKPFLTKKEMLEKSETKMVNLFSDVKDKNVWNKDTIEARANRLANEIIELYPIVKEKNTVVFKDPRYQEYTCEDPNNATNKTPNYYVLLGERVVISSFADLFKSLVMKLYDLDSSIIIQMAKDNETIAEWSNVIMFSYDENKVKHNYKIPNTNIYQNTGFNAWYLIVFAKTLLEKYDISYDEFIYSARPTIAVKEKQDEN